MTRVTAWGLAALTVSGIYLYTFPTATIPYFAIDLAHILGGLLFALLLIGSLLKLRAATSMMKLGWLSIAAGTAAGIALTFTGATRPMAPLLYGHIFLCLMGIVFLLTGYAGVRGWPIPSTAIRFSAFLVVALLLGTSAWAMREVRWRVNNRITNPSMPPQSQDDEGQGVNGDFFPSSVRTNTGRRQ